MSGSESDREKESVCFEGDNEDNVSTEKVGTFASLRVRDFRPLLIVTILSNAAQWIQSVTLSWLVYELTGSGTMLGTLNVVRSSASLSLTPLAGVLIDRINRKFLMISTNGWLFAISLAYGIILMSGRVQIFDLFLFTFLGGITAAITISLQQVLVFDLVPRRFTPNAVALVQTGWSLMRSIGPGIGGFLLLWLGPGENFMVQAGAYILAAYSITRIRFPARKSVAVRSSMFQNIREGFRYVVKEPVTRNFMMIGWILPLLIIPNFAALPPIYAKLVFHGGPEVLGYLLSSVGVGGILGGVVVASLDRFERRGLLQLGSLFLTGLSLIGFALCTSILPALFFLVLSGLFEMIFLTTNQTLIQLSIPDELRGRVTSLINLNTVLFPLGSFIAGAGSDLLGGPKIITIILCGTAAGIAVLAFLFSSTIRNYRLSQAINPD